MGKKIATLRTCIQAWRLFLPSIDEAVARDVRAGVRIQAADLFPIAAEDAAAFVNNEVDLHGPSREATRLRALEFGAEMGLDIHLDWSLLGGHIPCNPRSANPREAYPPAMCVRLEGMCIDEHVCTPQLKLYCRQLLICILLTQRGGDMHSAYFFDVEESIEAGHIAIACGRTKDLRNCVHFYLPMEGFLGPLQWAPTHMRFMAGRRFMWPDYTNRLHQQPSEAACPSAALAWTGASVGDPNPPRFFGHRSKLARTLVDVVREATRCADFPHGLSREQQQAAAISGTHPSRHVGPEIVSRFRWSDADTDVLGDWASQPVSRSADGSAALRAQVSAARTALRRGGIRNKRRPSRASYQQRASKEKQLWIRRRWILGARACLNSFRGGLQPDGIIPMDVSWQQVVPIETTDPRLRPFYGEAPTPLTCS